MSVEARELISRARSGLRYLRVAGLGALILLIPLGIWWIRHSPGPADPDETGSIRSPVPSGGVVPATASIDLPPGCRFYNRCPARMAICREVDPPLQDAGSERQVACHLHA